MNKLELIYDFTNVPYLWSHSPTTSLKFLGSCWLITVFSDDRNKMVVKGTYAGSVCIELFPCQHFQRSILYGTGVQAWSDQLTLMAF